MQVMVNFVKNKIQPTTRPVVSFPFDRVRFVLNFVHSMRRIVSFVKNKIQPTTRDVLKVQRRRDPRPDVQCLVPSTPEIAPRLR